jgi:FdrA protein
LKSEVGAITAHQALDVLARDDETKVIVLISKPPSPDVATQLISAAQKNGKPVVIYFIGYPSPARKIGNLHFAISLSEAAELAVKVEGESKKSGEQIAFSNRYLRGLFSGGTLAYETLLGLQAGLSPIFSNAPITDRQILKDPLKSEAHTIIDLGDEFFMVGRLHPMIDNDLRIRRMKQEAADPEVGMILFDVVLGEGSHIDPASELVPVIQEIHEKRKEIEFVAMFIGTDDDPQDIESQIEQLQDAGVTIFRTATEAVEYISLRFGSSNVNEGVPVNLEQLKQPLAAINVGLESFYDSLVSQGAQAVQVEWRPPAGGNEKMAALLAKMKK